MAIERGPRRDPLQIGERIAAGDRQRYTSERGQEWGGDA
jgi:hypothetical protein